MGMNMIDIARMLICVAFASLSVSKAFDMINDISVVTQTFSLVPLCLGFLLLIYGFSPNMAKQVIKAIVDIIHTLFSAIFK